jgi:fucose permease
LPTPAPASRSEVGVIYFTGVIQGLALVTFPAAGAIFTDPAGFGFSSTHYGAMFVPQVMGAVLASGLAPKLARRWSLRRVLLAGVVCNTVSMALLALSRLLIGAPDQAFGVLLVATGSLGLGFGWTVMALNTFAEKFFPGRADGAVLALNALLGLGTALAPLMVAIVVRIGAWWMLPVVIAGILIAIFAAVLALPLQVDVGPTAGSGTIRPIGGEVLPHRFWLYAAAVLIYGMLETLNGNWATLYLSAERGVTAQGASMALAAFWAMVTVGRVLTAMISARVSARSIYVGLPILLLITFQITSYVHGETAGIVAFAMAGLACSAFLPLSISFGGNEFPQLSALMAGELIAFYQVGYGVAAFGTGPLRDLCGLPFSTIYSAASGIALPLAAIAALIIRPPHDHRR